MRSEEWALIQKDWCPYKKRKTPGVCTHRKGHVRTQGKVSIYKPRRGASREPKLLTL